MISTLYVSPKGDDRWNGVSREPNASKTDGPLATFDEARKRVWKMRDQNMVVGVVTVKVLPGTYHFSTPLAFQERDKDMVFQAEGGEVVVDGSIIVDDFEETEVNGNVCWCADIKHVLLGREAPHSLFVNGERRPRSRYPKEGFLVIEEVPDFKGEESWLFDAASYRFKVEEGDFDENWRNQDDIEVIVNHLWIEERMPVKSYDPEHRLLTSTHWSSISLKNTSWMGETPCAKYALENVFEAMSEPGEWYIDLKESRCYYLPKAGEKIDEVRISLPIHKQLVRFHGNLDRNVKIEGIHFDGIIFQHTDWTHMKGGVGAWWDPEAAPHTWRKRDSWDHFLRDDLGATALPMPDNIACYPQAAMELPGAISFESASNCSMRNCHFRGLGFYAVDVRGGCSHLRFQGNTFTDIGGGGIKVDGADSHGDLRLHTHRIYIGDNVMRHLGEVYPAATGVLICHADNNVVEHNEISDLYYTAISVGWTWSFDASPTYENVIQYNHLHTIGQKRLSDMGAIYTLGNQPGTVIRGNHIHDVSGSHYGGWGIYLDQASSQMTIEENIIYRTNSQCYHEHWGRANVVRNNVFALPGTESIVLAREEMENFIQHPKKGCLFMRNVFLSAGKGVFKDSMAYFDQELLDSDLNLFWDTANQGAPLYIDCDPWDGVVNPEKKRIDLEAAKQMGLENCSRVADPGFTDPENGDFTVAPDSPVHSMNIKLLDINRCGPREVDRRLPNLDGSFRSGGSMIFAD